MRYSKPATTDNFPSLSAHGLAASGSRTVPSGAVTPNWRAVLGGAERASFWVFVESASRVLVEYAPVGEDGSSGEPVEQSVGLSWPAQKHFGLQFSFVCPDCGRGCRALYVVHRLACRGCCKLYHRIQGEDLTTRRARRAKKITAQLGPPAPTPYGLLPSRPPRMWAGTYHRLLLRLRAAEVDALRALVGDMESYAKTRQAASQEVVQGV
jgi:hypothetical protein